MLKYTPLFALFLLLSCSDKAEEDTGSDTADTADTADTGDTGEE